MLFFAIIPFNKVKKFILALAALATSALAISQPYTHDGFFLDLTHWA